MTAEQAIRFVAHEAGECRGRDASEALCLLLPAMIKALDLRPMEALEARAFRYELKQRLQDEAQRRAA